MVESKILMEEDIKGKSGGRKTLMRDLFYGAFKGIGGLGLKALMNLQIEGKKNVPLRGKALLLTISQNSLRDMLIISQLSGRKIHFMVSPKLMKHQVAGPLLKNLGMFRSTTSKDDTEPIDNVFKYLNEIGDLVAMTPEAKYEREIQVKSVASIIKFAILGQTPIIPLAVFKVKTMLFNSIASEGLKVKVGNPIMCDKSLNREKNRDKRYELAEDIVNIIETLRTDI